MCRATDDDADVAEPEPAPHELPDDLLATATKARQGGAPRVVRETEASCADVRGRPGPGGVRVLRAGRRGGHDARE
jgi:hypothetical protein